MILRALYERSPIWLQHVMATGAGYLMNRGRYGPEYKAERQRLRDFDTWSLAKKREYQLQLLREFLKRAQKESPFYAERIPNEVEIDSLFDLQEIPILSKETLRAESERIYTIPRSKAQEGHTGGTTGKSLVVRFTKEDMNRRMAMLDHFKARVGFEHRQMRRASFTGRHVVPAAQKAQTYWRYNHASRQMLYSSMHLSERTLPAYLQSLNRFKPDALDGFPSAITTIASFILRREISIDFKPLAIFPTSETLSLHQREVIEAAFGSPVYDQYSSSEGAPFITECRAHRLHVELDSGVFERQDDGSILVTSFTTHGTPLIRYAIGDRIGSETTADPCECGVAGPVVSAIEGRSSDYLIRADGAKVYEANVANLFKNLTNSLVKAQLRQDRIGLITAMLVVDRARWGSDDETTLRSEFSAKFGAGTDLQLRYVDEIPRASSGKHRLVDNRVADR